MKVCGKMCLHKEGFWLHEIGIYRMAMFAMSVTLPPIEWLFCITFNRIMTVITPIAELCKQIHNKDAYILLLHCKYIFKIACRF